MVIRNRYRRLFAIVHSGRPTPAKSDSGGREGLGRVSAEATRKLSDELFFIEYLLNFVQSFTFRLRQYEIHENATEAAADGEDPEGAVAAQMLHD